METNEAMEADDLLNVGDDDSDLVAGPSEQGELREEAEEKKPGEVVAEALQEMSKVLLPAKKESALDETELRVVVDQLEKIDGQYLGMNAKKTLLDLTNTMPRLSSMIGPMLGFRPSRRSLYTPGIFWGCLKHKRGFLESIWKVIFLHLMIGIGVVRANDCESETNTSYSDGYATMHTGVRNYKTQLFTEQIDLKPLRDLEINLENRVNSVELSKMSFNDPPLQCDHNPVSPTDLLKIGKTLFNNNQYAGVFIAPISCNQRYSVIASMSPIGMYARKSVAISNTSLPIYCSYFPTSLQQVQMLASNDRSNNVPSLGQRNPMNIYMTLIKHHLVNPDTGESCVFLGNINREGADSVVIGKDIGIYECLELCYSIQRGNDSRYACELGSYDLLSSTCYMTGRYNSEEVDYLLDYSPTPGDFSNGYYTVNWMGKCLSKEINYEKPTIVVGDELYNVADVCEYLIPEDRIELKNKMLGKITDGAEVLVSEILKSLRNLTGNIIAKYSIVNRHQRSTDNVNWMAGLNTGKSVLGMIKQISEITKLGMRTWQSFNTVEQRPGFNNANLLHRVSSSLKSRGQSANVFKYNENGMHKMTNQLELFANQYSNLLNGTVAKVDIKRLHADFLKIKSWIIKLLKDPLPLTVKLSNTRDYLYSPAVMKHHLKNVLYRRFLRIEPDKKDMNNMLLARFPVSPETYKEENFRSSFGPVINWKNCLSGNEKTCRVVKGKTNKEITTLSHGDQFDSTLVAVNRKEFQLIAVCNHQNTYFKRHSGYTVALVPPSCKLVVDNETVVEPRKANNSPCGFRILFTDDQVYPKSSPPSIMEMIKSNIEASRQALLFSIAGITLALIIYFRSCCLFQRRHRIPDVVLTKVRKLIKKEDNDESAIKEISRPLADGEDGEPEFVVETAVRSSPRRGNEYHF